jgi:hypothetical protein
VLGVMGRWEKLDMTAIEARLNRAAWLEARNAACAAGTRFTRLEPWVRALDLLSFDGVRLGNVGVVAWAD